MGSFLEGNRRGCFVFKVVICRNAKVSSQTLGAATISEYAHLFSTV